MVDMADLTARHSGKASDKRIRKRRAAEMRLKLYGIVALLFAAGALVALLGSVFTKVGGAMSETYLMLPITLDAAQIDPDGTKDSKIIRRADFTGLTKDMLKMQFPNAKGRKLRRQLYDLTSSGAPFELADKVAADPSLVGQEIEYRFLASDVTDLYLKGAYGGLTEQQAHGKLTLTRDGDDYIVSSASNDFSQPLERVKQGLLIEAKRKRGLADLQHNGVVEFTRRAKAATTDSARQENLNLATARATKRDALLSEAQELVTRAEASGGNEPLSEDNRSILIKTGGGWLKMTSITPNGGRAEAVVPLSQTVTKAEAWSLYSTELPQASRKVSDHQIIWIEQLKSQGRVDVVFNTRFFTASDSREPELAGIWGAAAGSFWTMLVTFSLAFPIGVMSAIYLEEFAPKNKFTDFVEVNINNLAAVPSIVFGLLGLSVFLGVFGVPRSAPLAGGIVLALMTLPTIIIASRAAIRAVPPSIRDAAVGLGASPLQSTFHHVFPMAMPGILTGTIIGMAQALGETAPLIMIGMVAFIVDIPGSITDSASVLPVQVYRWSDFPERAFEARTAAAICVLLLFLVAMNLIAVLLRKRFERRW